VKEDPLRISGTNNLLGPLIGKPSESEISTF
jgi:hypothetical protein